MVTNHLNFGDCNHKGWYAMETIYKDRESVYQRVWPAGQIACPAIINTGR